MFKKKSIPDNKTIKCKLKTILEPNIDYDFLHDVIKRTNKIVFACSHFIRLYILHQYQNNLDIPELNIDFIMMAFKAISKKSYGPKPKKNKKLMDELNDFAYKHFFRIIYNCNLNNIDNYKFDARNLSYILRCSAEEMRISYMNNIQMNFFKYVCQFINQVYNVKKNKKLKQELRKVKDDIVYGEFNSDKKYHNWITEIKDKITPSKYSDNQERGLKYHYHEYLKYMLYMNKYLENNNLKTFQPISLRTDIKDKYITLNTNALIDILPNLKNKNEYFKNISEYQNELWHFTFILTGSSFKLKKYSFNYQIQTDGFSVSINYINNDLIEKKKLKIKRMIEASKKAKEIYKGKSREEIADKKDNKKQRQIELKIKNDEKYKIKLKEKKEKFKKLPKEEQEKIKLQKKIDKNEFNYIGNLIKTRQFLEFIKREKDNLVYVDPGKRTILTALGENGEKYNYRTKKRLKETKRLKYNRLIDNKKKNTYVGKLTIKEYERQLSIRKLSGKTINVNNFKRFMKMKYNLRNKIDDKYNNYLMKLNWFGYINKRRHEDKLLNELENKFGKKAIFIVGDWGNKGKLSYISTPGVSIKRKLNERFNVYHIDEYKTSQIHYKTKKQCKNLYLEVNIGKIKKMHSILTFQMGNGRLGCINRDNNATKNMQIIVKELLQTQKRPIEYRRSK